MHVITRRRLRIFAERHPDADASLDHWYRLMKRERFRSFAELRAMFPHADQVGRLTVFNIGGNKARVIASIHYNRQKIFIREVLTHSEYDRGDWRE